MSDWVLLAGTAHPQLARALATALRIEPAACQLGRFPDGEVSVRVDEPVHGRGVILVQPTSRSVDENLIELLALADACRRAGASRLVAVIPYFGYARADNRHGRNEPVTASLVARLIQAAGFDHVIGIDLHSRAIEGFFQIPVENLSTVPLLCDALRDRVDAQTVVVSPDLGRVPMATAIGQQLRLGVAVVHKHRTGPRAVEARQLMGDVRDRPCVVVDDMISTGGTIVESVRALTDSGAQLPPIVATTHGVFTDGALPKLASAGVAEVIVTDTVPSQPNAQPRVEVVSVVSLLADALRRLMQSGRA